LPFIVQLLSTEVLEKIVGAYATLEALPEARENKVTVGTPYQHGGWITEHLVRMDPAFMQAETALADFVANLDPWSGVVPEALILIVRRFAPRSRR
jgi:hypothetical protein